MEYAKENPSEKTDWGWHGLVLDLAGDDILKVNKIYDLSFLLVLNWLSRKKELRDEQNN